jgi:WD40 repeat protein
MNMSTRAVHKLKGAGTSPIDQRGLSNHIRAVKWCTINGNTHHLAVATSVGYVRVFDTTCGKEVVRTNMGCRNTTMHAVCWNDSRQWLTAGYANGKIGNLDLRSGCETVLTMEQSGVCSSSFAIWYGTMTARVLPAVGTTIWFIFGTHP